MMASRIRRLVLVPAAAALAVLLPACGNDDPAAPEDFRVTIEVVDTQGRPVSGLDLALAPDVPFYGEKTALPAVESPGLGAPFPSPFYPAVRIDVMLAEAGDLRLSVEDVAGTERRLLAETAHDAGSGAWVWDGRDDAQAGAPSGVYYAHLVVRDPAGGGVVLDQRRPMLLARLATGDTGVGATDAAGRIVLDDRRLFPFLYGVEPFAAMDETGEPIGLIVLTAGMRFHLSDPVGGARLRYDRDVTGPSTFRFVWDPVP